MPIFNSFAFDFLLRTKVQATVNLFILNSCPVPVLSSSAERFLAHAALCLSCNHEGFRPLWAEQGLPVCSFPVLASAEERLLARSAIDAVVAAAYGLNRGQYAQVLGSFSHKSNPTAPALCLAAFDELEKTGLEAFCLRHDPYEAIPLPERLPEPVIKLAAPEQPAQGAQLDLGFGTSTATSSNSR